MVENIPRDYFEEVENPKGIVRKKSEKIKQLDITSLVDILTILLVFLIKNVSVEAQRVTVPEQMMLPTTVTVEELSEQDHSIVMRVFPDNIYISDIPVGSPEDFMEKQEVRKNLANYMQQQSEIIKSMNPDLQPTVLLQADKSIKCRYITELVSLVASSHFTGVYFSSIRGDDPEIVYDL